MPSGLVRPSPVGISTRRTGGGKSLPEDTRFQSLERLFVRSLSHSAIDWPSTPAAPWLALTCLYASQTSRVEILNGFAFSIRCLPSRVDPWLTLDTVTPSLQPHDRAFLATTGDAVPVPRLGTLTLMGPPLAFLPWHRGDRFPRSAHTPGPRSRRLHAGRRLGSKSGLPQTPPGLPTPPPVLTSFLRFRHVLSGSLALVSVAPTGPNHARPCPHRSPPRLLTCAA